MRDKICILVPLIILILIISICLGVFYNSEQTKTVTVKEKWTKYHDGNAKYLFSDTNGTVYEITDQFLLLKFDASDRYAKLEENHTYKITTYGWRFGFFSWYENVVEIKEV